MNENQYRLSTFNCRTGKRFGTDEAKFLEILAGRSNAHLRATFAEYEKLCGKAMVDSVKEEMSGDLCNATVTIVRCIQHKPAYFAFALNKAMGGIGNATTVMRIVITRCEVDLLQVKEAYQAQFGKSFGETLAVCCFLLTCWTSVKFWVRRCEG